MSEEKVEENQNNRIIPILAAEKKAGLLPAQEAQSTSEKIMGKMANVDGGPWTGGSLPRANPNDDAASKMQSRNMTEYGGQTITDRIGGPLVGAKSSPSPRDAQIQADQASDMVSYPAPADQMKPLPTIVSNSQLAPGQPTTTPLSFGTQPSSNVSKTVDQPKVSVASGEQDKRTKDLQSRQSSKRYRR